ncbi:hypothetical protein Tco_1325873 [Tanacetum coccineum]
MGCCRCFGFSFTRKQKPTTRPKMQYENHITQGLLSNDEVDNDEEEEEEEDDDISYGEDMSDAEKGDHLEFRNPSLRSQEILVYRTQNGLICREFPVKETHKVIRSENDNKEQDSAYFRDVGDLPMSNDSKPNSAYLKPVTLMPYK